MTKANIDREQKARESGYFSDRDLLKLPAILDLHRGSGFTRNGSVAQNWPMSYSKDDTHEVSPFLMGSNDGIQTLEIAALFLQALDPDLARYKIENYIVREESEWNCKQVFPKAMVGFETK